MSWIIGVVSKKDILFNKIPEFIKEASFIYNKHHIQLYAGGLSDNLFINNDFDSDKGWIVSGVGLKNNGCETSLLGKKDWANIINQDTLENIDGHFALITWSKGKVKFHTDVIGLRDIYILEDQDGILFSTRPDWIVKLKKVELDFCEFGSRWMLFNQLSAKSVFKRVIRLVGGKSACINSNSGISVEYFEDNWFPITSNENFGLNEYHEKLNSLINLNLPNNKNISLSLSGGMDSRVILSFLINSKDRDWETHTFGNPEYPDSIISNLIMRDLKMTHEQINLTISSTDEYIRKIEDYTSQTIVNGAASAIIQLNNYSSLVGRNSVIIDGGFGEIWRREFFYRLYLKGSKALFERDIDNIVPHLRINRSDIFSSEINNLMLKGIRLQLEELFEELPSVDKNSLENWLDLFAIKTRLVNFYSHEQSRLDNYVTGVMPFIQPSLLKHLPDMKISLRKNGRLFKKIIKKNSPNLGNYKLAKGQTTHPFFYNSLQARISSLIKKKLKINQYTDNQIHIFLDYMKEYILDISNSQEAKQCSFYDSIKINNIISRYYKGEKRYANDIDWWLSFELFRKNLL